MRSPPVLRSGVTRQTAPCSASWESSRCATSTSYGTPTSFPTVSDTASEAPCWSTCGAERATHAGRDVVRRRLGHQLLSPSRLRARYTGAQDDVAHDLLDDSGSPGRDLCGTRQPAFSRGSLKGPHLKAGLRWALQRAERLIGG